MKKKRIGILGGTFNPLHVGHLVIAQAAQEKMRLDRVVFVPCYQPPHKQSGSLAAPRHRLQMVRLSVRGNPHLSVSDFEIKKKGKSYSIDTVHHFRQHDPQAELFFIIGEDSLPTLPTWRRIKEILKIVRFIVIHRPGKGKRRGKVKHHLIAMPGIDIASSDLRRRIVQRRSIRYLVPDAVFRYIQKHKLYRKRH